MGYKSERYAWFPSSVVYVPKPPIHPPPPRSLLHTHQVIPGDVEEVEAIYPEVDILPFGGHSHHRLHVVPGHIMVETP